jgi:hypothetical protein
MVWAPAIPAVTLSNLVGTVEINTDDIRELVQQIEALPSVPTNVIQGWVMYDSGSNVWIQITVSNLTFWGDFIDE